MENVKQYRYDVPNISTKINLLKLLLADKENFKKVMIFTETKKNADRIVERLADHWKGELSVIHSNKAQNTRLKALRSFKEGETRIMVASDVAARGIDVQDVSHVINFLWRKSTCIESGVRPVREKKEPRSVSCRKSRRIVSWI